MSRLPGVVAATLFSAAALTIACAPKTPPEPATSLLLVTIDTLRADRVGAYGGPPGLTPFLDRLAAAGWVFEKVTAVAPLTLPSHATLLSGLDPMRHGVHNNGAFVFPNDRDTLATLLKARGFATGAFVAAVVLDQRYGLARGFDVYDDRISRAVEGRSVLESERSCDAVVASATRWIEAQRGPFFAWVHFYEPHAPYVPPPDLAGTFASAYDAEVAAADRCFGRLNAAAAKARPGRLVTAVASDHGEGLGEHGESTHGLFVYQTTLSVPLVVSGPGVPPGKRARGLTRAADLAPTLLGVLGLPVPGGLDGRDLSREAEAGEAYAESEYGTGFGWAPLRSWRLGDLKLIDAPRAELYDLAADPGETRNLAAARAADVDRLRGVLKTALSNSVSARPLRVSGESEERLRSLGYVAGAAFEGEAGRPMMDPKDAVKLLRRFEEAMAEETRGDLPASIRILRDLVGIDRLNVTFHRSLASALRRNSRPAEAGRVLEAAAKIAPRSAEIAHDQALALADQGRMVQAIESEERALTLDPGYVDALDHLATLQAGRERFDLARTAVDRALALDPNHARAWVNRGNIVRSQGNYPEAERSFRRALELSPELGDALNGLGVMAAEAGRLDEAAGLLDRALAADPRLDEARLNLAVVEVQRGKRGRAIELAERAMRDALDPKLRARARAFLRDLDAFRAH